MMIGSNAPIVKGNSIVWQLINTFLGVLPAKERKELGSDHVASINGPWILDTPTDYRLID